MPSPSSGARPLRANGVRKMRAAPSLLLSWSVSVIPFVRGAVQQCDGVGDQPVDLAEDLHARVSVRGEVRGERALGEDHGVRVLEPLEPDGRLELAHAELEVGQEPDVPERFLHHDLPAGKVGEEPVIEAVADRALEHRARLAQQELVHVRVGAVAYEGTEVGVDVAADDQRVALGRIDDVPGLRWALRRRSGDLLRPAGGDTARGGGGLVRRRVRGGGGLRGGLLGRVDRAGRQRVRRGRQPRGEPDGSKDPFHHSSLSGPFRAWAGGGRRSRHPHHLT